MAVTVPGSNGGGTVSLATGDVADLVRQIAGALNVLQGQSLLNVTPDNTGTIPNPPNPLPTDGTKQELVLSASTAYNTIIPLGYDYVVINNNQSNTLTGTDLALASGTIGGAYTLNGNSTLAAAGGNNTVTAFGTYDLSFGPGNNSVTASGTGDIALGTGAATVVSSGNNNIIDSGGGAHSLFLVNGGSASLASSGAGQAILGSGGAITATLTGANDTLSAGTANTNATIEGANAVVFGGTGSTAVALNVSVVGYSDTIAAFDSNATVNAAGSNDLIFGGTGTLNAVMSGNNDTLVGGSGAATVNADGGVIFSGTGPLSFVGGATATTIVGTSGGSETATVGAGGLQLSTGGNNSATIDGIAGAGKTTLFGGAGSKVTFVETADGAQGFVFVAGSGAETVDASQSNTRNLFVGGADTAGSASLIGGSGDDGFIAGNDSETLAGGAGRNEFLFVQSVTSGQHYFITDFTGADAVFLSGYNATGSSVSTSGGLTLTLSDNTRITFTNLTDQNALNGKIGYG